MINQIYQLTKPKFINVKYQEEAIEQENHILIRPNYMAVCHADQRYYQGKRDPKILNKKLPMAMIHESMWNRYFWPDRNLGGRAKSCYDSQSASYAEWWRILWELHDRDTFLV